MAPTEWSPTMTTAAVRTDADGAVRPASFDFQELLFDENGRHGTSEGRRDGDHGDNDVALYGPDLRANGMDAYRGPGRRLSRSVEI